MYRVYSYNIWYIYIVVWIYSTFAMQPDQQNSLLMTQIGSLDITKSNTFEGFFHMLKGLVISTDN